MLLALLEGPLALASILLGSQRGIAGGCAKRESVCGAHTLPRLALRAPPPSSLPSTQRREDRDPVLPPAQAPRTSAFRQPDLHPDSAGLGLCDPRQQKLRVPKMTELPHQAKSSPPGSSHVGQEAQRTEHPKTLPFPRRENKARM